LSGAFTFPKQRNFQLTDFNEPNNYKLRKTFISLNPHPRKSKHQNAIVKFRTTIFLKTKRSGWTTVNQSIDKGFQPITVIRTFRLEI